MLLSCGRTPQHNETWGGSWDVQRSDGGGRLVLQQQGDRVTGTYEPQEGHVEATASERRLDGTWHEGDQSGSIELLLGDDGKSFAGRGEIHGWWTGQRYGAHHEGTPLPPTTLDSPRDALLDFLFASNVARTGDEEAWGAAEKAVEFSAGTEPTEPSARLRAVRDFFEVIDLTTIDPSSIPTSSQADTLVLRLEQPRSGESLDVTVHRDARGAWHIVVPPPDEVAAARKRLLAAWGKNPPTAQSFRRLGTPRDAVRALLEGMDDWEGPGRALALSALDLRQAPGFTEGHGVLLAQYLRRTLQSIGLPALQAIPDDPTNRDPVVLFSHAAGSVAVAPRDPDPDAPWQFTADTIDRIQSLYLVTEGLSPSKHLPPGRIPPHPYFALRTLVGERAPFLLHRIGRLDRWQALLLLAMVPLAFVIGAGVGRLASMLLDRSVQAGGARSRVFPVAIAYLVGIGLLSRSLDLLGFPERLRKVTMPTLGSVAIVAAGAVAWHLLALLGRWAATQAKRTPGQTDDIAVNLVVAAGRVAIVVAAALATADLLSIPATHILTGLGIGGLAFAVAARDTLANILGAGNLVTDRPFRSGDWIDAGIVQGSVEAVGMRSTRIRTAEDSVAVIPNGRLSDALINNLGARRHRVVKLRLPVTEGATPDRLQAFVEAIRGRIVGDSEFVARETEVGVSDIENGGVPVVVKTYLVVKTDAEEVAARHALAIDLLRLAEEHHLRLGAGMPSPQAGA